MIPFCIWNFLHLRFYFRCIRVLFTSSYSTSTYMKIISWSLYKHIACVNGSVVLLLSTNVRFDPVIVWSATTWNRTSTYSRAEKVQCFVPFTEDSATDEDTRRNRFRVNATLPLQNLPATRCTLRPIQLCSFARFAALRITIVSASARRLCTTECRIWNRAQDRDEFSPGEKGRQFFLEACNTNWSIRFY